MSAGEPRKPSTRWSVHGAGSWGPYWEAMFPPAQVTSFINWKIGSTGVNIARNYWYQRQYLRRAYESVYGADPANWPSQHPGVVVGGRHPACLRCHYFDPGYLDPLAALDLARRHETSGGEFLGPEPAVADSGG